MKALNIAFEILTGVDPDTLGFEASDVTFFARTGPDHVTEMAGLRIELTMTGGTPQDWVYAASFAGSDGAAYLATYSGKVILVSREGQPLVVYDIGACPFQIVDTGRYTYFLTPTRLYVVEDRTKLAAFLDVFQEGRLLVSPNGFGLLTSKRLQWFTEAGKWRVDDERSHPGHPRRRRQCGRKDQAARSRSEGIGALRTGERDRIRSNSRASMVEAARVK